jgi:N-acetylmuramoyl-L-alanine amidase
MMFSWSDYIRAVATTNKIPSECGKLRVVQLAQAILESARGTSILFQEAGNPGGLKWREHIDDNDSQKITEKVWLKTPSQPDGCYWCQWKTAEHAAIGYWRFIDRPNSPYQGWQQYLHDPKGYLQYIWEKGYATDPNYVNKVKGLFPQAQSLLVQYKEQPNYPQRMFKIAIMPGHGGSNSGAINPDFNICEKDYNWKEAVEIKTRLETRGNYQVIICRGENELPTLATLQQQANNIQADVCLCLHHNACNGKAKGWWLFYANNNPQFETFIQIMDRHFRQLPLTPRGYEYVSEPFTEAWHKNVWNCIHRCQMPTILFESCFIDNNEDALWLKNGGYQQIAEKICAGVQEYLEGNITPAQKSVKSVVVNDPHPPLNVRSGPGTNFQVVSQLGNNTALTVVNQALDNHGEIWLEISSPCSGWVFKSLTSEMIGQNQPAPSTMSESEKYDYYCDIITRNGGRLHKRNLISFRKETSTKANNWDGCYDDITVMIWEDSTGKHVRQYSSNTEPSSQYEDCSDQRADRGPVGVDANGDGILDLGRLPAGYYEYQTGSSEKLGKVLRPTKPVMLERDTNHNGIFERYEPRASAGKSILFHAGGVTNPCSAGCQTLNPTEYTKFWNDLNRDGNPGNIGYTLVNWC